MENFKCYLKSLKTKIENVDELKGDSLLEMQLEMFVELFNDKEFQQAVKEMEQHDNDENSDIQSKE